MTFGEKNVDKLIRSAAVEKKGASQTWRVAPKGERMDIRVFSTKPAIKTPDRIFLSGVALIVTQNRHSGGQGE